MSHLWVGKTRTRRRKGRPCAADSFSRKGRSRLSEPPLIGRATNAKDCPLAGITGAPGQGGARMESCQSFEVSIVAEITENASDAASAHSRHHPEPDPS